jgi:hypothetical protein
MAHPVVSLGRINSTAIGDGGPGVDISKSTRMKLDWSASGRRIAPDESSDGCSGVRHRLDALHAPAAAARPSGAEAGPGRASAVLPDAAGVVGRAECQSTARSTGPQCRNKQTWERPWSYRREWPEAEVQVDDSPSGGRRIRYAAFLENGHAEWLKSAYNVALPPPMWPATAD